MLLFGISYSRMDFCVGDVIAVVEYFSSPSSSFSPKQTDKAIEVRQHTHTVAVAHHRCRLPLRLTLFGTLFVLNHRPNVFTQLLGGDEKKNRQKTRWSFAIVLYK